MQTFNTLEEYLDAIASDSVSPILPLTLVADHLKHTRGAIDKMITAGKLQGIKINGVTFVGANSLLKLKEGEKDKVDQVRQYLEARRAERRAFHVLRATDGHYRLANDNALRSVTHREDTRRHFQGHLEGVRYLADSSSSQENRRPDKARSWRLFRPGKGSRLSGAPIRRTSFRRISNHERPETLLRIRATLPSVPCLRSCPVDNSACRLNASPPSKADPRCEAMAGKPCPTLRQ